MKARRDGEMGEGERGRKGDKRENIYLDRVTKIALHTVPGPLPSNSNIRYGRCYG